MSLSNSDIKKVQFSIDHARDAEGRYRTLPKAKNLTRSKGFWARLTGEGTGGDAGKYSWTRQKPSDTAGELEDITEVTGTFNAYEVSGLQGYPTDSVVFLFCGGISDDEPFYFFQGRKPYELFPVEVSKTGGSAGDKTTKCSYTYTAKTIQDLTELGISLSPEFDMRTEKGKYTAAEKGTGYFDDEANFVLWQVNEVPGSGECT